MRGGPLADDAGHLHDVGEVVQQDEVVLGKGMWTEGRLQTAEPVDGGCLVLLARSPEV